VKVKRVLRFDNADTPIKDLKRFDCGNYLEYMYENKDGFLCGDGVVTRTGVFTYVNADGSLRKELRHPEDVLSLMSLNSMKMIPVTDNHPTEFVTSENSKSLMVGYVGENIRPDGIYIIAPIVITNKNTVDSAMNGKQQLSLGYETDLVEEAGEYDGVRYDFRQTNIRYNHLAIVISARAGAEAKLKFDSYKDYAVQRIDTNKTKKTKKSKENKPKTTKRSDSMKKFVIDGIDYDAAPEVINFINKLQNTNSTLTDKVNSLNSDLTTVKAERDDKEAKLQEALKKTDNTEEINRLALERSDLVTVATKVINDEKVKLDGLINDDIKKEVIKKVYPDTNFDTDDWKNEVYIKARYDAVVANLDIETLAKSKKVTFDPKGKKVTTDNDADTARDKMREDMMNAHLPKEK